MSQEKIIINREDVFKSLNSLPVIFEDWNQILKEEFIDYNNTGIYNSKTISFFLKHIVHPLVKEDKEEGLKKNERDIAVEEIIERNIILDKIIVQMKDKENFDYLLKIKKNKATLSKIAKIFYEETKNYEGFLFKQFYNLLDKKDKDKLMKSMITTCFFDNPRSLNLIILDKIIKKQDLKKEFDNYILNQTFINFHEDVDLLKYIYKNGGAIDIEKLKKDIIEKDKNKNEDSYEKDLIYIESVLRFLIVETEQNFYNNFFEDTEFNNILINYNKVNYYDNRIIDFINSKQEKIKINKEINQKTKKNRPHL